MMINCLQFTVYSLQMITSIGGDGEQDMEWLARISSVNCKP